MSGFGDLLFRKASQLLGQVVTAGEAIGGGTWNETERQRWIRKRLSELRDGQILFSKNNVCVHESRAEGGDCSSADQQTESQDQSISSAIDCHCQPGYFTVRVQFRSSKERRNSITNSSTLSYSRRSSVQDSVSNGYDHMPIVNLVFTWIPNSAFNKKFSDVCFPFDYKSMTKTKVPGYAMRWESVSGRSRSQSSGSDTFDENSNSISSSRSESKKSTVNGHVNPLYGQESNVDGLDEIKNRTTTTKKELTSPQIYQIELNEIHSLRLFFDTPILNHLDRPNDSIDDVPIKSFESLDANQSVSSLESGFSSLNVSESNETQSNAQEMTTTQISSTPQANGKLVIGSTNSRFKILHFHCGGLDRLGSVLDEWKLLLDLQRCQQAAKPVSASDFTGSRRLLYYCVNPVQLEYSDCHPDEYRYTKVRCIELSSDHPNSYMDSEGRLVNWDQLRRRLFFVDMDSELRSLLWPFLLGRFSPQSDRKQRENLRQVAREVYDRIDQDRLKMNETARAEFYRKYGSTIEKDVPRTDRRNSLLRKPENSQLMERVLLNFAFHCPDIGYTQGFSDLLAPLILTIKNEAEVFTCFVNLLKYKQFVCFPNDQSMDLCIGTVRELLRCFGPLFYSYFTRPEIQPELLFIHRWMLLCFRREFSDSDSLRLWANCWVEVETYGFQFFVCIAIILLYGEEIIERKLSSDEILLHFTCLSQQMDAELIMKKARGLVYKLRTMSKIPCSLLYLLRPDNVIPSFPSVQCISRARLLDSKLCRCPHSSSC